MKDKLIKFYQHVAASAAELSTARRAKVGAVIVKNNNIISFGYNGTLPGHDNNCEKEQIVVDNNLLKEIHDYLIEFPRPSCEYDLNTERKHFWFKGKCYLHVYLKPSEIIYNNGIVSNNKEKNIFLPPLPKEIDLFYELTTKPEVIHAEQNAIYKLAKSNENADGAIMFITHAPCKHCVNALIMSKIKQIYYTNHHDNNGIAELEKSGIIVTKI